MSYTFWLGAEGDLEVRLRRMFPIGWQRYVHAQHPNGVMPGDVTYVGYVPTWAENAKRVDRERRFHTYSQINAKLDKLCAKLDKL